MSRLASILTLSLLLAIVWCDVGVELVEESRYIAGTEIDGIFIYKINNNLEIEWEIQGKTKRTLNDKANSVHSINNFENYIYVFGSFEEDINFPNFSLSNPGIDLDVENFFGIKINSENGKIEWARHFYMKKMALKYKTREISEHNRLRVQLFENYIYVTSSFIPSSFNWDLSLSFSKKFENVCTSFLLVIDSRNSSFISFNPDLLVDSINDEDEHDHDHEHDDNENNSNQTNRSQESEKKKRNDDDISIQMVTDMKIATFDKDISYFFFVTQTFFENEFELSFRRKERHSADADQGFRLSGVPFSFKSGKVPPNAKFFIVNEKNIFLTGFFNGSINLYDFSFSSEHCSMFLIKMEMNGEIDWMKEVSGVRCENHFSIDGYCTNDEHCDIYLSGPSSSNTRIGETEIDKKSDNHAFLLSINSNGTVNWLKEISSNSSQLFINDISMGGEHVILIGGKAAVETEFSFETKSFFFSAKDSQNLHPFFAFLNIAPAITITEKATNKQWYYVIAAIIAVLLLCTICVAGILLCKKRKEKKNEYHYDLVEISKDESNPFEY